MYSACILFFYMFYFIVCYLLFWNFYFDWGDRFMSITRFHGCRFQSFPVRTVRQSARKDWRGSRTEITVVSPDRSAENSSKIFTSSTSFKPGGCQNIALRVLPTAAGTGRIAAAMNYSLLLRPVGSWSCLPCLCQVSHLTHFQILILCPHVQQSWRIDIGCTLCVCHNVCIDQCFEPQPEKAFPKWCITDYY